MHRLRLDNRNTPEYFNEHTCKRLREDGLNPFDDERFAEMTKYFKGGNFLDLGIGDCPVCYQLIPRFPKSNFYALDFSDEIIKLLREKYPVLNYVCCDALDMPYKNNLFDYIISGEVLEHMEKWEDFLKEVFRVLKPGGVFSLSTPDKESFEGGNAIDYSHLWSFEEKDVQGMLKPFGKVKTFVFTKEHHNKIIAHCWKK